MFARKRLTVRDGRGYECWMRRRGFVRTGVRFGRQGNPVAMTARRTNATRLLRGQAESFSKRPRRRAGEQRLKLASAGHDPERDDV